jgi:required for meiotic nuclear division protein 1
MTDVQPPIAGGRITVRAFDVASSYDIRGIRKFFSQEMRGRAAVSDPLLFQLSPRKIIVVFDYGSIVFFDFEMLECERILAQIKSFAQRPNKSVLKDEFTIQMAPKVRRPEGVDELSTKEFNRDTAMVVAVVLSRSVALEYYESMLGSSLGQLGLIVSQLAEHGRIPRSEKELTKQVGGALLIEHELAYYLSVFDDPDIIWEGGSKIETLYKDLKREFDLDERIRIIQQKVSIISRWSTFVISRLEGYRSRMLEWLIIVLILSEILLVLFGKM